LPSKIGLESLMPLRAYRSVRVARHSPPIPATLAETNCPSGLVGGSSILTGEHGTGLESNSEGVRNRASVVEVSKIPIYDAAARLTAP